MWIDVFRKIFKLFLEYIGGFVMALVSVVILSSLFTMVLLFILRIPGDVAVGWVVSGIILINIPLGGMLGIVLVDRYLLKVVVGARQIIFGILTGIFASACLMIINFFGAPIFDSLPYDGPNGIFGGFGLFYIVCILSILLGYTIAGKKLQPSDRGQASNGDREKNGEPFMF